MDYNVIKYYCSFVIYSFARNKLLKVKTITGSQDIDNSLAC